MGADESGGQRPAPSIVFHHSPLYTFKRWLSFEAWAPWGHLTSQLAQEGPSWGWDQQLLLGTYTAAGYLKCSSHAWTARFHSLIHPLSLNSSASLAWFKSIVFRFVYECFVSCLCGCLEMELWMAGRHRGCWELNPGLSTPSTSLVPWAWYF